MQEPLDPDLMEDGSLDTSATWRGSSDRIVDGATFFDPVEVGCFLQDKSTNRSQEPHGFRNALTPNMGDRKRQRVDFGACSLDNAGG